MNRYGTWDQLYQYCIQSDYLTGKNFTEGKRALRYIHPLTLNVEFTARVGAKLRC